MIRINLSVRQEKSSVMKKLDSVVHDLKKRTKELDKIRLKQKLYDLGYYDEISRSIFKRIRRRLLYPFRWIRWKLKRKDLERARRWMDY